MKSLHLLLLVLLCSAGLYGQSPEKMSYQAILRDAGDALIVNQGVGIQVSVLQSSASGTAMYVETHSATTNANGLVSLEIGTGTPTTGTFSAIDWSAGPYFLKRETDPTTSGGTSYTITGTTELLSVPYAMHAKTVDTPTYSIGLWPELGGYVFWVSTDGKHGLVAETIDQSTGSGSNWYEAQGKISNPSNHSTDGQKFRDWRMPTKYELNEMYLQKSAIGGFGPDYWSSTENTNTNAWKQNFTNGNQNTPSKSQIKDVRAVRAF